MKSNFFKKLAMAAFGVVILAGVAYAQNVKIYKSQGGASMTFASGATLTIASGATFTNGGVAVPVIRVAQDAVASGQTSKAVTVTGITTASKCTATPNEVGTNAAYVRAVVPTANTATVTVSADPGASNLDLTVICLD